MVKMKIGEMISTGEAGFQGSVNTFTISNYEKIDIHQNITNQKTVTEFEPPTSMLA